MSRSNSHITDIMKLGMTDFKVEEVSPSMYAGGVWNVRVELPDDYPYKSPSIGFVTKIYNPNIDESSGSVCLNILNQERSPCLDLEKLFYVCLPQLLKDPNPDDPLNHEAAALMMQDRAAYEKRVREYCERYAKPEEAVAEESEEDRTDNEYESSDDKVAENELKENELEVAGAVSKMSLGEED